MKKLIFPILLPGMILLAIAAAAQTEEELLSQLLDEERGSVEALALYPKETRVAILEAAKYPEALIKLESVQSKTSESFKNLMERYPRETQEMMWDLTRYQGLVSKLANYQGTDPQLVLEGFPPAIHERARDAFSNHRDLLKQVDFLNGEWDSTFRRLIEDYPLVMQDAMRQLVDLPEVLTILTDNIRMTVLVGDLYRNHPAWLLEQMDSLNLAVARDRAKETADWKQNMDNDPQAREEFTASASAFAAEYGYDDAYYSYDDQAYDYNWDGRPGGVEPFYYYHYPYWFGYPYWYMYPRWRPYPYWYDWGFYYGPGNVVVILDLPSFYFTNWYFYYPQHCYRYPHLSSHFVNHYYGHRTSGSSVSVGVDNWRSRNRDIITNQWIEQARSRPESFREYGQFEEAREKYNRTHSDQPLTQRDFLDKNARKFKDFKKEVDQAGQREALEKSAPPQVDNRRAEPAFQPPRTKEPSPQDRAVEKPRTAPAKPRTEPPVQREEPKVIPNIDKGSEYHRNTWEKAKPNIDRRETAPQRPQVAPPKQPTRQPAPPPKTRPQTAPTKKGGGREG